MNLQQFRLWAASHHDIAFDLVRIYLGLGLFIKALFFLFNREYLLNLMHDLGPLWIAPAALAHYVIPAHLVGGLLLAVGLLTRWAALIQLPILFLAVFYLYLPRMMLLEPRQHLEFSALVLVLLVLFLIFGAGRWSVDHYLTRREKEEEDEAKLAMARS